MKSPSVLKALPVLLLLLPAAVGADTLTMEADRDNTLYEFETDPMELQIGSDGVQALSNGAGDFFLSADGETVYYSSRDEDGPGLFSVPIGGGEARKLSSGNFSGLRPTRDKLR